MDAPPISLGAYAKHRGVSKQAVSKAAKCGRLSASVARDSAGKVLGIADVAAADREWDAATDLTRGSVAMKERAARAQPVAPPPPAVSRPPPAAAPSPEDPPPDLEGGALRLGMGLAAATEAEKVWKARTSELAYRERSGELVEAKAMEAQIADAFSRVRARLLGLSTRAKQQLPHLAVTDVGAIDSLVREALEALDDELTEAAVG